jgi:hypothetical protein
MATGRNVPLVSRSEFTRSIIRIRSCSRDKWPFRFLPFTRPRTPIPFLYTTSSYGCPGGLSLLFFSPSLLLVLVLSFGRSNSSSRPPTTPLISFPFKNASNRRKISTLPLHFLFASVRILLCISVSLFPYIDCISKTGGDQTDIPRDRDNHPTDHYVRIFMFATLRIAYPFVQQRWNIHSNMYNNPHTDCCERYGHGQRGGELCGHA